MRLDAGHLLGPIHGDEADVRGFRERLAAFDELLEGKSGPGHRHRPGFDAAKAINALFEFHLPDEFGYVDLELLFDESDDVDRHGKRIVVTGQRPDLFVGSVELVEVVVAGGLESVGDPAFGHFEGDVSWRGEAVSGRVLRDGFERSVRRRTVSAHFVRTRSDGREPDGSEAHLPDEHTPIAVRVLRRYVALAPLPAGRKNEVRHWIHHARKDF